MARPKRDDKKEQRHTVLLRPALWDELEQRAATDGVTVNRVIEQMLEHGVMPSTPQQSAASTAAAPYSR